VSAAEAPERPAAGRVEGGLDASSVEGALGREGEAAPGGARPRPLHFAHDALSVAEGRARKSPPVFVVGLGHVAAGDEGGVGPAVLKGLRQRGVPEGVELVRLSDPLGLVPLLEGGGRVVLVDAMLAPPAGAVLEIELEELSPEAPLPASSHAAGAMQAFELARALSPLGAAPDLRVVAITIDLSDRCRARLSPAVDAAVPRAVERVLALLSG
jgi:hydrogenase maturation protease